MEYSWKEYRTYEPYVSDELVLHVPSFDELTYRQKLLADASTMSYNAGYDLPFENYDRQSGCIDFDIKYWREWYENWIDQEPRRFYAYVMRKKDNCFVGEVSLHEDPESGMHETGVVIEARYRSNGYGKQALQLLMRHAFYEMGVKTMHNYFEADRYSAFAMHVESGFVHIGTNEGIAELICSEQRFCEFRLKRLNAYRLSEEDAKDVLELYQSNPRYFEICPPAPSVESVKADMNAVPEGFDPSRKCFSGWYELNRLIGVSDVLEGWPDETTVWIGLFMIEGSHHKEGLGKGILEKLCQDLQGQYEWMALGCMKDNTEGLAFWKENGFEPYRESRDGIICLRKRLKTAGGE